MGDKSISLWEFYFLPKIHKHGNPGRHILSSINSPTERISALVNVHLQPIVRDLSTFQH